MKKPFLFLFIFAIVALNLSLASLASAQSTPAVIINDSGPATPYPSTYTVSGASGVLIGQSLTVKINGLTHSSVNELALVLEGPTGARLLLQSGSGGNHTATNISYSFRDNSSQITSAGIFNGAVYRPAAFENLPVFSSLGTAYNNPGPVNNETATLSNTFNGTNPNGIWKLYAFDVAAGNGGEIKNWSVEFSTASNASFETSATYVGMDSNTKGNWIGKYGSQVSWVLGTTGGGTSGIDVNVTALPLIWANTTSDIRALQKPQSSTNRIAAASYTPTQTELVFDMTDDRTHRVALYAVDWDSNARQQTFEVINTETGALLNSVSLNNFNGGVYVVWQVKGRFKIRLKNDGGQNAVVSGIFVDPPPTLETSARYVGEDSYSKGNWVGNYGTNGYSVIGDTTGFGGSTQFSVTGQNSYTWASSTTDTRALKKVVNNNDRIAATYYTPTQLDLNIEFTNGFQYRVALYCLDWDNTNRNQTIEIINADTGTVLDTRTINNFSGGRYIVWNLRGKVKMKIKNAGGNNAVVSGIFVDPVTAPLPGTTDTSVSYVGEDGYTKGNWQNNYGNQGYSVVGNFSDYPSAITLIRSGGDSYTWAGVTTDLRALQKIDPPYQRRIAATIYSPTEFSLNFNLMDGQARRLALYALDWEGTGRKQTFELLNTDTGAVLDTRTISNFNSGRYIVWTVKGKFTVRIKNAGGTPPNVVLSGFFFDNAGTALPTPPPAVVPEATFVGADNSTHGNWSTNYGAQGNQIIGGETNLPAYSQLNITGQNLYAWEALTTDTRALRKASSTFDRTATTLYTSNQMDLNFELVDGQAHRLALYALDWEGSGRKQTFELLNTETGAVLDTRTISNYNGGLYMVWTVKGKFTVRIKNAGGTPPNAVLSGIFFDAADRVLPNPPAPDPNSASFVRFDTNARGNWLSSFGGQGYSIVNDATALPSYAQLSVTNQSAFSWMPSTNDVRALIKPANQADRIAATYYAPTQFELNFNLTDGNTHRLALYALDWEGSTRQETFELVNTDSGAVLDTRTISNFNNGVYIVWDVRGKVTVRVKKVAGANAVLSGIFLDSLTSDSGTTGSFYGANTNTQGNWSSIFGTQGYSVINDATNFPAYTRMTAIGQNAYTWAASTTDVRALTKATNNVDRIAATYYAPDQMTFSFYFTDEQTHRLSIYNLDWDTNNTRSQILELVNTTTGVVLDTRTVNNFSNGVYTTWYVKGKVTVRVKKVTGPNAVISGVFIDN